MKKTKYIKFLVAAMLLGGLATSCMDDDWNDPTGEVAPYGNNDIVEDDAKMISIKELKTSSPHHRQTTPCASRKTGS